MKIPATEEYIHLVQLTLYGMASRMSFTYEEIEDMKIAVAEACHNAVYGLDQQFYALIDVKYTQTESGLAIRVKVDGEPGGQRNISYIASQPCVTQETEDVGVLRYYMMQSLMDEVNVMSGEGTEVTLTKYMR